MSNTGLFVFARQENKSSNELYLLHDQQYTNTGLSIGTSTNTVARLSYKDGSGAVLESVDSLTLKSDKVKIPLLTEATSDLSYNFMVINGDGVLQKGSAYFPVVDDTLHNITLDIATIKSEINTIDTTLLTHNNNISTINTIISQLEHNLTQIQLDLNTLTTVVMNEQKIQTKMNWLYGIVLALLIGLVIISIVLFVINRHSSKLISSMKSQLDTMSKDMSILKKAMIEIIKSQ